VQPSIYKNFLLRGITPLDTEYKLSDLAAHLLEVIPSIKGSVDSSTDDIDFNKNNEIMRFVLAAYGHDVTNGNNDLDDVELEDVLPSDFPEGIEGVFRKHMYKEYIVQRRISLKSLKKGIRLNGKLIWKHKATHNLLTS
jgi:hypothetical protein